MERSARVNFENEVINIKPSDQETAKDRNDVGKRL